MPVRVEAGVEELLAPIFARRILELRAGRRVWTPQPHQVPPSGDWYLWLLLAGRGAGKTDACAHYVDQRARAQRIRIAIIAPTLGDAMEACVNGPSGLKAHNPSVRSVQGVGGVYVRWPNGSEAKLFGASTPEDVERLRAGGNRHLAWAEELAAWRKLDECWTHMEMGNRLGLNPNRVVASTTPKPKPKLKALIGARDTAVTRATTRDNPHLDPAWRTKLFETYEGTTMGRQELEGELIEDVDGALWTRVELDEHRVSAVDVAGRLEAGELEFKKIVVSVDPAVTATEKSDEVGIVAAALGSDGHGYVLADASSQGESPDRWARRAVNLWASAEADEIVYEANQGGDLVKRLIETVARDMGVQPVLTAVHASRGKRTRAEPVAALHEQGKVHIVGALPRLEDQLCEWVPTEADYSPGRLDAHVWALSRLMVTSQKRLTAF